MDAHLFQIRMDGKSALQLQKQLYIQLRELILKGELLPGVRLPPSRKLAEHLKISRKTVVSAYDQLLAEGYVTSQTGSGTFVSPNLPETESEPKEIALSEDRDSVSTDSDQESSINILEERSGQIYQIEESNLDLAPLEEPPPSGSAGETRPRNREVFSAYGKRLSNVDLLAPRMKQMRFPFFNWQPAFDEIPLTEWARIVSKTFRRLEPHLIDYATDPLGHLPLRQAIAERLRRARGLNCQAEQVAITCGLIQSLDLIARLHISEGDELLVENPSYRPVRDIFRTHGALIRSIDVDQGGMKTERLAGLTGHSNVKVIYVTPSHQYPTGAVLTLARRLELLKWATESGAMVIEDDFDSEFRYRGSPIPAMKTLDKEEQVIYLSSFTKIFYPSLAISFMVLPPKLIPIYTKARWLAADQISLQLQEALAEFISAGYLERHVKRMRVTYAQRRKALVEAVEEQMPDIATVHGDYAGLSTLIRIKANMPDEELLRRANALGIALTSTLPNYTRNSVPGEFILGYGNLSEEQIRQGIIELRLLIKG